MGFSRQKYWSGLHFLLQGIFLIQGLNPYLLLGRQILYPCESREGFLTLNPMLSTMTLDIINSWFPLNPFPQSVLLVFSISVYGTTTYSLTQVKKNKKVHFNPSVDPIYCQNKSQTDPLSFIFTITLVQATCHLWWSHFQGSILLHSKVYWAY